MALKQKSQISEKTKKILEDRKLGKSIGELGQMYGVTRQRIYQILKRYGDTLPTELHQEKKVGVPLEGKNKSWKGTKAGYATIHNWVSRRLGKSKKCEHCGSRIAKKYDWANKNHKYKRILGDWIRLCSSCHVKYDARLRQEKIK